MITHHWHLLVLSAVILQRKCVHICLHFVPMKWWLLLIGRYCMEKLNFCTRPFWSNTFRIYNITRNCKSGNTEVKQQNIKQLNFEKNTPPCRSCTSRSLSRRWYNPPPSPWTPSHLRQIGGNLVPFSFFEPKALRHVVEERSDLWLSVIFSQRNCVFETSLLFHWR